MDKFGIASIVLLAVFVVALAGAGFCVHPGLGFLGLAIGAIIASYVIGLD